MMSLKDDITILTDITVPIVPEYLFRLWYPNVSEKLLNPCSPTSQSSLATLYTNTPPDFDHLTRQTGASKLNISDESCNITELKRQRHELMANENIWIGIMFGSKPLVQGITNPFVGKLTNRIGYTIPMFVGFIITFFSTMMFAFGSTYGWLLFARALQGIGSSSTSTAGMGMLAKAFPDTKERGSAMGIALGGLALGVVVGPTYGGLLYDWAGISLPFVLLAILALFDGILQLLVLQPHVVKGDWSGAPYKDLLSDPYIIITAGALTMGNFGVAMLEPSLPIWMMETMDSKSIERGAAFLPCTISFLIGTNLFGRLAYRFGRWLCTLVGIVVIGVALIPIPFSSNIFGLIVPLACIGFAMGMINSSVFPQLGYLVDLRHVGVYGNIYAIGDAAICLAYAFGPFLSGPIVRHLGFPVMMFVLAAINIIYAPLIIFLRNPPAILSESNQS